MGDNSCFPATRLRTPNRLAYPFFKLSMLRMTNDEVLMAFHVFLLLSLLLLSPLVAWSTLFAPSWAGAQARREGVPRASQMTTTSKQEMSFFLRTLHDFAFLAQEAAKHEVSKKDQTFSFQEMAPGASTRGWFLRDVLSTSPDFSERMSQVACTTP